VSRWRLTWLSTVACAALAGCATPGATPARHQIPASALPPVDTSSPAAQKRDEWRHSRARVYFDDFGELARYRAANAALGPPLAGEARVVFYGDSITDLWPLAISFPDRPYVNRGISGQTTAQMLVRFRQDVVGLAPKVVVILAGTNDIAGNTGPVSLEEIEANFASMVELARAHGIRVVLSSVLPVHNYTPQSALAFPLRPPETIAALNAWLRNYAAQAGAVYLDYTPAMSDPQGFMVREMAADGLHPNRTGYGVMAPLAETAIQTALALPLVP
jgi:lysophospholipase L1-like esterase